MNKDMIHDTVPVASEQRNVLELAIVETKETDQIKEQENTPESSEKEDRKPHGDQEDKSRWQRM